MARTVAGSRSGGPGAGGGGSGKASGGGGGGGGRKVVVGGRVGPAPGKKGGKKAAKPAASVSRPASGTSKKKAPKSGGSGNPRKIPLPSWQKPIFELLPALEKKSKDEKEEKSNEEKDGKDVKTNEEKDEKSTGERDGESASSSESDESEVILSSELDSEQKKTPLIEDWIQPHHSIFHSNNVELFPIFRLKERIAWPGLRREDFRRAPSWEQKAQLLTNRKEAISRILEQWADASHSHNCDSGTLPAPNANSMAPYLDDLVHISSPEWRPLFGFYSGGWSAPHRASYFYRDGRSPHQEEFLPAFPKDSLGRHRWGETDTETGDGDGVGEEVMKGFLMKRPAVSEIESDPWGGHLLEPECRRPVTSGLPRLDETQIQWVENRIKWYRQRPCVSWARNMIAAGQPLALLSTACRRAWEDWYPKNVRDLITSTLPWRMISRACRNVAQRFTAFLCGASPRAGRRSPISLLSPHLLVTIVTLCTQFKCDDLDGLQREPPQTEFEKDLQQGFFSWIPTRKNHLQIGAFGNFDVGENQADMGFHTIIAAYALLHGHGPLISLEEFVSAVEVGNVGNLKCYALFRNGAFARTPQQRFMAIRLYESLFDVLSSSEQGKFRKCFTGEGSVTMADGSEKKVCDVQIGDHVKTESGIKTVCLVEMKTVEKVIPMCEVGGVWLTPGHPVFMGGIWTHPFEISPIVNKFVSYLFNFELSGGPLSPDHSIWINNLLVCTLGKDCGTRIVRGWPKADEQAGTGYWCSGASQFSHTLQLSLSSPLLPSLSLSNNEPAS
ncbi:hypothetical protein Pelo_14740 [Pelomyxa schiedti]|nr:hypothetical protein Pelo_14740 [Pelomyxa schiedti]